MNFFLIEVNSKDISDIAYCYYYGNQRTGETKDAFVNIWTFNNKTMKLRFDHLSGNPNLSNCKF